MHGGLCREASALTAVCGSGRLARELTKTCWRGRVGGAGLRGLRVAGFVEVETPTLFKRTPGGAAEFPVPTQK